jgi:hypothetical protein
MARPSFVFCTKEAQKPWNTVNAQVPEGKGANGQEAGLTKRNLSRVPDQKVLSLNPDRVNKDDGNDVRDVLRCPPGKKNEEKHKGSHPNPGPGLSDQLKFLFVALYEIHSGAYPRYIFWIKSA